MDGLITVAARFSDGTVECQRRLPESAPAHMRRQRVVEGDEDHVRTYFARAPHAERLKRVEPSGCGLVLVDFIGKAILQMTDFTPLDRQDVAHLAFCFQRRVNPGEREASAEFARSGRIRRITRRRELTGRKAAYSAPGTVLSLAEFQSVVENPEAVSRPTVTEGAIITPMFLYDFHPMVLEVREWNEGDGHAVVVLKNRLDELGFA